MATKVIDALPTTRTLAETVVIIADGHARIGEVSIVYNLTNENVLEIECLQRGIHRRVVFNKIANWAIIDNDAQLFAALAIKLGIKDLRFGRTFVLVKNRHVPPVLPPATKESKLWLLLPIVVMVGLGTVATLIRRFK